MSDSLSGIMRRTQPLKGLVIVQGLGNIVAVKGRYSKRKKLMVGRHISEIIALPHLVAEARPHQLDTLTITSAMEQDDHWTQGNRW